MNKSNLSPLSIIEEAAYQKVKNVHFDVWQYVLALALLTVIPSILGSLFLPTGVMYWLLFAVVAVSWLTSRVIGRNISRNKGIDSVLLYRYFAAVPWMISVIATGIQLLIAPLDDLTRLMYTGFFWLAIVVSLMHVLGIIIHHYKSKRMIKNVKKDELFQ